MRSLLYIVFALSAALCGLPIERIEDKALEGDKSAIGMLRDSAAAGSTRAMNFLGYLYWQSGREELKRDSALWYLRQAAAMGDAKGAANLGHLLLLGDETLRSDTAEALRLLDFAAGRRAPSAIRELADYFERHPGDSASAGAMKKVADAYARGHILRYNYNKSIEFYHRAALLGDSAAIRIVDELRQIFPDRLPVD